MRIVRLLVLLTLASCARGAPPRVADGDIVFQTSRSAQSVAIQRATGSKYSHMGVVLFRDGKPFVFEAVQPVRWTPFAQWTARGEGGHYVVKRLKSAPDGLSAEDAAKLRSAGKPFEGLAYDLTFEWSDRRQYCSEIVWKMYDRALGVRVGELQRLRDFDLDDPLVKAKLRERYGKAIPLDERVISPRAMFDSPLLVTVGSQ